MLGVGYSEKLRRGHVSWQGKNIFLTPAHDWMHERIQYWTWKWYPSLMTSTVWSNCRQGIITILVGGTVGWFWEPIRGFRIKVETSPVASKIAGADLPTLPIFLCWRSDLCPSFNSMKVFHPRPHQNTGYNWAQPFYGLVWKPGRNQKLLYFRNWNKWINYQLIIVNYDWFPHIDMGFVYLIAFWILSKKR